MIIVAFYFYYFIQFHSFWSLGFIHSSPNLALKLTLGVVVVFTSTTSRVCGCGVSHSFDLSLSMVGLVDLDKKGRIKDGE
jgi:hypothetical protein